ncbi:hypothetical protein AOC36_07115 [Erysipelothrix larvae]|uniref:Mga helix-turn-helix domain-containing protein n=1 Tax=Erysipelothrix larvae TaxID=1514105 RepID=A0A0X8H0E6_9FIRM|nr:helix-turn-helix domain-containing protein [Erysipelothrix larvae]AMC93761.1 hypothetical protein AOC36_07115 [Erysipelothrix larvae]
MIIEYKKSVYRLIKILELLLDNDRSISIRDIAIMNQCTERTVYNDINYLVEHWNHLLHLDISHTSLISQNTSIGNIQYVTEQIFVNEPITRLLKMVIEVPYNSVEFYSSALELSHQVTRNLLNDLKRSLESHGLSLYIRSKRVSITGNEFDIRYFCAVFYHQFEHSFRIYKPHIEYTEDIAKYTTDYTIISRFIDYIEYISVLRFNQNFFMVKSKKPQTLQADINAMVSQYIKVILQMGKRLEPYEDIFLSTFSMLGYRIPVNDTDKIMAVIASILYMDTQIFEKFDTRVQVVNLFVKNYSKVNPARYYDAEYQFTRILENFTDNYLQVIAGIIYVLDMLYPITYEPRHLNLVVYSGTSFEHAQSLKRQLEIYFPRHSFYIYNGKVEFKIPDKQELDAFCKTLSCNGIITTLSFPYQLDVPMITVSDYFVGTDIGRIFDFINATKR